MGQVVNVLDLMSERERTRLLDRYKSRTEKREEVSRVSPEVYILAELGYFYGWEAVRDVRNNVITLEEVYALIEGAKKVWYSNVVDRARASQISTGSLFTKSPAKKFNAGMKPFIKAAEVNK